MSNLQLTEFSSFTFTEEEFEQGSLLTELQKQILMTSRAQAAQEIINLELDATNLVRFAQKEAGLKGQIRALTYILDCSTTAEEAIRTRSNH